MCEFPGSHGFLKIGSEADRGTVASILFKNGYSVSLARKKKKGKATEYYVEYEVKHCGVPETESEE